MYSLGRETQFFLVSYRRTKTLVIVLEGGSFLVELEISFGELREKIE
jgi:hypothetical protein